MGLWWGYGGVEVGLWWGCGGVVVGLWWGCGVVVGCVWRGCGVGIIRGDGVFTVGLCSPTTKNHAVA